MLSKSVFDGLPRRRQGLAEEASVLTHVLQPRHLQGRNEHTCRSMFDLLVHLLDLMFSLEVVFLFYHGVLN